MNEKHIGRSVRRLEDSRFLVGRGRYVADIDTPAPCTATCCARRTPMRSSSGSTFRGGASLAGVHGIYTAGDLAADGLGPLPCMAAVKPLIVPPRPALAEGRVRHVGDPVAFIVADSEDIAREAAELVEVDYQSLPAVVDGMAALAAGAPAIWEEAPGNLAFQPHQGRCRGRGAGDEASRARRRRRGDEQPCRRRAHRARAPVSRAMTPRRRRWNSN